MGIVSENMEICLSDSSRLAIFTSTNGTLFQSGGYCNISWLKLWLQPQLDPYMLPYQFNLAEFSTTV